MRTVIMTGGKSRRMGQDKATLLFEGETLSLYLARRYEKALGEVCFAVDEPGRHPSGGYRELCDPFPGKGPCNGLVSGLEDGADYIFLTATDMPFGDPALALCLREQAEGYDACLLRRQDGRRETLFAVYGQACARVARELLRTGNPSFRDVLAQVRVHTLEEADLPGWDLSRILRNINTPEEYRELIGDTSRP